MCIRDSYYTELTDVLRTYMEERFGFNAMEMTSSEIIDKLQEINDKESIKDFMYLFQTADLVDVYKRQLQPLANWHINLRRRANPSIWVPLIHSVLPP